MAAFRGRQARCKGFIIDFVGYFGRRLDDSFLTRWQRTAQESANNIWGVRLGSATNFQSVRLATEPTRVTALTKRRRGAG